MILKQQIWPQVFSVIYLKDKRPVNKKENFYYHIADDSAGISSLKLLYTKCKMKQASNYLIDYHPNVLETKDSQYGRKKKDVLQKRLNKTSWM